MVGRGQGMVCTVAHPMLIPQLLCTTALQRCWFHLPSPGAVWKLFTRCQLKTGKRLNSLCSRRKDPPLWQEVGIFKLMKQRRTEGQVDLRLSPFMGFVPRSQGRTYRKRISCPCISQTLMSVNSWCCNQVYGQLPLAQMVVACLI